MKRGGQRVRNRPYKKKRKAASVARPGYVTRRGRRPERLEPSTLDEEEDGQTGQNYPSKVNRKAERKTAREVRTVPVK